MLLNLQDTQGVHLRAWITISCKKTFVTLKRANSTSQTFLAPEEARSLLSDLGVTRGL